MASFFYDKGWKVVFDTNEVLVRAGDVSEWVYWVECGFVRQYALSLEGEELTVYLYGPKSVFFVPWVFELREVRHYFEAVTAVEVWRVRKDVFGSYMKENPWMASELMQDGFFGLKLMMMHMEGMVFGNAGQKIAAVVLLLAEYFGRELKDGRVRIRIPLTHRFLATIVGMARETVTTELGGLKRKGWVEQKGRWLEVVEMDELREMVGLEQEQLPRFGSGR
jgi:CRP-like cAMP-binding protein